MQQHLRTFGQAASVALALASATWAHADVIDGSTSGVTRSGNDHTVVVAPADVSSFTAYQNASVDVTGGEVAWMYMNDDSQVNVSGGEVSWLHLMGNSHGNITGGDISWLQVYDHSTLRISGVEDLSWLVLHGSQARVEVVADNVTYSGGHLSGTWGNGQQFSFWAVESSFEASSVLPGNISITAVPEPSTWLLGLLGVVGLATVRSKRAVVNA